MKKIELIDYLRGFAIFTIALMHLIQSFEIPSWLQQASSFGGAGVHVFFLCSGFGLFLSHLRIPLNYGEFLKKRFLKIYIPYVIVVLLWSLWTLWQSGSYPLREFLSHIFLYKMFFSDLDVSLCYPYWFISTIIQFYLVWPLLVYLIKHKFGLLFSVLISLVWSTVLGVLGYEDFRPWGSCFLQYLWEFALGMWFAQWCSSNDKFSLMDCKNWNWFGLFLACVLGVGLTGLMGICGGLLKLYNDIPSLLGYLSLLLIVWKLSVPIINRSFIWLNKISFELYLVHSLIYSIFFLFLVDIVPTVVIGIICIVSSLMVAFYYDKFLRFLKLK